MRDVIARDLWDAQQSAHAQVIDLEAGKDTAMQVGSLLLTASLSTAVNAVKGLTREEMVECLVSPLREPSEFLGAFEELDAAAVVSASHARGPLLLRPPGKPDQAPPELRQRRAGEPDRRVDPQPAERDVQATRKTAYQEALPLPPLDEVAGQVRRGRVLVIVSPDSRIPPEEVQRFFDGLSQKNNLCVLTGDKTAMGSVEKAARPALRRTEG